MSLFTFPLEKIAYARSGDKGSSANIGVIAKSEEIYHFLEEELTESRVFEFLKPMGAEGVKRFSLPNLNAFNFLFPHILQGGASHSLRYDSQGKALGQILLQLPLSSQKEFLINKEGS